MKNNRNIQITAYKTIVRKEVLRFSRIWKQTLIPPIITNILYFIIFGNLIGERIGQIEAYNYTDFIFPGLLLMSVITHSYTNHTSQQTLVPSSEESQQNSKAPCEPARRRVSVPFSVGGRRVAPPCSILTPHTASCVYSTACFMLR